MPAILKRSHKILHLTAKGELLPNNAQNMFNGKKCGAQSTIAIHSTKDSEKSCTDEVRHCTYKGPGLRIDSCASNK